LLESGMQQSVSVLCLDAQTKNKKTCEATVTDIPRHERLLRQNSKIKVCWDRSLLIFWSSKQMFRIIAVLAILAGIAYGGFYLWSSTPEYSIGQVKDAFRTHDRAKFDKFVDADEFAGGMVDDLLTNPVKEVLGGGTIGRWVVAGMAGMFKPQFVSSFKSDLYALVENGNLRQSADDSEMSLALVERRLCLSKNEFKKVDNVKTDGKLATVTVVLHNKMHDKDMKLDVQMQKMDNYWRVTKMLNFPEFAARIAEVESVHKDDKTETVRRI